MLENVANGVGNRVSHVASSSLEIRKTTDISNTSEFVKQFIPHIQNVGRELS